MSDSTDTAAEPEPDDEPEGEPQANSNERAEAPLEENVVAGPASSESAASASPPGTPPDVEEAVRDAESATSDEDSSPGFESGEFDSETDDLDEQAELPSHDAPTVETRLTVEPFSEGAQAILTETFVWPSNGREFLKSLQDARCQARLVLVHGESNTGRNACAVNIASSLADSAGDVRHLFPPPNGRIRLVDLLTEFHVVQNAGNVEGQVFVVRDLASFGIQPDDFDAASVSRLNDTFSDWGIRIVATVSTDFASRLKALEVETFGNVGVDLAEVKDRHSRRLLRSRRLARTDEIQLQETWSEIAADFGTPPQVANFCLRYAATPAVGAALLDLVASVCQLEFQRIRAWFESLDFHVRLYALLLVLFENLPSRDLDQIYALCLKWLKATGMEAADPRGVDSGRLLELLHLSREGSQVRFDDIRYRQEVERRLAGYHELLWSFMARLVELLPKYAGRQHKSARVSIGSALGRLGAGSKDELKAHLLALIPNESTAAVSGYALAAALEKIGPAEEWIVDWLREWAESRHLPIMKAATMALPRVYESLSSFAESEEKAKFEDELWHVASDLAGIFGRFDVATREAEWHRIRATLGKSATQAEIRKKLRKKEAGWWRDYRSRVASSLEQIATANPEKVVDVLRSWLSEYEPVHEPSASKGPEHWRYAIASAAAAQFFIRHSNGQLLTETRHLPFLELIPHFLGRSEDLAESDSDVDFTATSRDSTQFELVFNSLGEWIEMEMWTERVHRILLKTLMESTRRVRLRIVRYLLQQWTESESQIKRRVGLALVSRARALDGAPFDVPGHGSGLLLLDATGELESIERLASSFVAYIRPQARVQVGFLGCSQVSQSDSVDDGPMLLDSCPPRLLGPILEKTQGDDSSFVAVVATQVPYDLEDFTENDEWERKCGVLLVGRGDVAATTLPFVGHAVATQLASDALAFVDRRLAAAMMNRDFEGWLNAWQKIEPDLPSKIRSVDDIRKVLDEWCEGAIDPEGNHPDNDIAARMIALVQTLQALDPDAATRYVNEMMEQSGGIDALGSSIASVLMRKPLAQLRVCRDELPEELSGLIAAALALSRGIARRQGLKTVVDWLDFAFAIAPRIGPELWESIDLGATEIAERADHSTSMTVSQKLKKWATSGADEDWTLRLVQVGERAQIRMLLGKPGSHDMSALEGIGSAIVFDTALSLKERRVALEFVKNRFSIENLADRQVVLFRLGESRVVHVSGDKEDCRRRLPADEQSPRLLGPILDRLPADIGAVIVLSNRAMIDEEDWRTKWGSRMIWCGHVEGMSVRATHLIDETLQKDFADLLKKVDSSGGAG